MVGEGERHEADVGEVVIKVPGVMFVMDCVLVELGCADGLVLTIPDREGYWGIVREEAICLP